MSESTTNIFEKQSGKKIKLSTRMVSEVNKGSEGKKGIATISLIGNKNIKNGPDVFLKMYQTEGDAIDAIEKHDRLLKAFRVAKENGEIDYIPLPQMMRRSKRKVIASELTEGGKKHIVDHHSLEQVIKGVKFDTDKIGESVDKISEIALRSNIVLDKSAYALIGDEDGSNVYLVDFGNSMIDIEESGHSANTFVNQSQNNANEFKKIAINQLTL